MTERRSSGRMVPIAIGVIGIVLEIVALALLSSRRLSTTVGTPLVIVGMLMAFVPIFVLARRARR